MSVPKTLSSQTAQAGRRESSTNQGRTALRSFKIFIQLVKMPPKNLPTKLKEIRLKAGLSQISLARALNFHQFSLYPSQISQFERGESQPSLFLLLAYARFRGVSLEILADDELSLE